MIQGKLSPRRGRVKIGSTVRFGVLSQQLDELKPVEDDTIREVLARGKRYVMVEGKETSPEKLLERLGFTQQQMWSRIKDLSGGQKRRLSLLLTILEEPNVLILDEPGNDLDTDMLALVEDLLDSWPGTLILVTHDRFLMERVTDQQWAHQRHVAARPGRCGRVPLPDGGIICRWNRAAPGPRLRCRKGWRRGRSCLRA